MVVSEDSATHAGEVSGSEIFSQLFGHLSPHPVWHSVPWLTNYVILMMIAGAVVLSLFYFGHAAKGYTDGRAPKGRVANLIETLVLFVRDQMVYDIMGKETGRKFAPLFLTQFFFIWTVNILGILPIPKIGGTATSYLPVTAALASTTLVLMFACSIKASGPIKMWTNLVPSGVPAVMWPLMFVVEVLGFFIKPFVLTMRLFANMMGGHLVFLALFGMIYLFQSYLAAGAIMSLALFVGLIELLVAFLQAFIFTFLSVLFIQSALHPDH